jgi:formamidopyrimidine-DNA glycosylase
MPELPDVELFRHASRKALRKSIAHVTLNAPRLLDGISRRDLSTALAGTCFVSSRRHGKHLFLQLGRGRWLALHFGMTGTLVPVARGAEAPPYTRMRIDFDDGNALAYTSIRLLGHVGLTDDVRSFIAEHGLGPDALDRRLDNRRLEEIFASRKGATRVKAVLMDQSLLAGIGNVYSDEILYQARVHPLAPARCLTAAQVKCVYSCIGRVLKTAIECRADSEAFVARLPRGFLLRVRGLDGRCPRCGSKLGKFKLSGRAGYYCPSCQPEQSCP